MVALCALVTLAMVMPVVSLVVIAAGGEGEAVGHVTRYVLPRASRTTFIVLAGVAVVTAVIGSMSAWLVSYFDFPGRRMFAWALMLPLAIPTYISAYGFVEFLGFTGPVQTAVRQLGGFENARQYWFPEIRSLGGTVMVLSLVLYPYVYLSVRALFLFHGGRLVEAARVAGAGQWRILFTVLLPLARPAIVLGVLLALMETINDIGAIEYLGVETLTFSVFSLWLNQGDLHGAAQLALFLLALIVGLIVIERRARRGRRFYELHASTMRAEYRPIPLSGLKAAGAFLACALPIALGFGIPFAVQGGYALDYLDEGLDPALGEALTTSVLLALAAALATTVLALIVAYGARAGDVRINPILSRIASFGYAIPGTIIALGIFLPLATFDNFVDGLARSTLGISTGLLISGSGAIIVYAYVVRFMAMAEGSIDGGFKKLPPHLDMAARSLGRTAFGTLTQVLLPLMRPALATAFLLVFVDSIKELSATIMLRPFGINTLSTYIYDFASRARVEQTGLASLIIIAAGIIPVAMLTRTTLTRGRSAG